ncbi:MAG: beta-propeller domain-containing protein [Prosthecobacter sp.]|nr:beta-propeller domain-containing protein [Prosthecobacter sp.]
MIPPPVRTVLFVLGGILAVGSGSMRAASPMLPRPVGPKILPITGGIPGYRLLRTQTFQRIVTVPKGVTQVVMEQRQGTGWKPVKVEHLNFGTKEKSKVIPVVPPRGVALSQIRMVAYNGKKFPAGFTHGEHDFSRDDDSQSGMTLFGPTYATTNPVSGITLNGAANLVVGTSLATADARVVGATTTPEAVESDIWKVSGNQLFFFNQFRGLQVFDMTHPETPVRTGTLRMAAKGEQMYVLDEEGSTLALLGKSSAKESSGAAALFLVKVTNGVPVLIKELLLSDDFLDSRLIGSKLYLLTQTRYNYQAYYYSWSPESSLKTIDLSDPAAPVTLTELKLDAGYSGHFQVSGRYLLVGGSDYYSGAGQMSLVDTETADGAPVLVKSFPVKGQIQDKFKMSIVNGAAVAVTLSWSSWQRQTWVETFPIEGSDTAPLAQIELEGARNENLHATRFDGNRLYAVTFRNTDPLFVVDLTDPTQPSVQGMLVIPGWSTYLEPQGDRLLAVGVEAGHVTVSLFDVADATAPSLLSRLALGEPGMASWSEANYDEKAVEYFPEDGLMLVPFQMWAEGGYQNAMQTIEVGRDALTAGVTIPHKGTARRGAVIGEHIVSISGKEMLVLNRTATTSEPEAELSLAWRVDRVVPFGDYLLQLADGAGAAWDRADTKAMIRVAPSNDPDALVEEIELGAGRIVGTAQKGSRLFVAQWVQAEKKDKTILRTWVLDLSAPPKVRQITSVEQEVAAVPADGYFFNWDEVQGLWVDAGTLVWYVSHQPNRIYLYNWISGPIQVQPIRIMPMPIMQIGTGAIISIGMLTPAALDGGTLIPTNNADSSTPVAPAKIGALDVASNLNGALTRKGLGANTAILLCPILRAGGTPAAGAVLRIGSDKELRGASRAFAEGGFIFSSYDEVIPPTQKENESRLWYGWGPPAKLRSWLQVVDFNATTPVVRDAVSIPGSLLSVSQADAAGAVILTNAERNAGNSRVIQASAYDGVTAYQLDSRNLELPTWNASTSDGTHLFFARGGETPGVIALGYDNGTGHLAELSTWSTTAQATTLSVVKNYLLASSYGLLEAATLSPEGALAPAAIFDTPGDLMLRVDRTVIDAAGLWIPASDYGVEFLPWQQLLP